MQQSKFDFQLWVTVCADPHALQARVMPILKNKFTARSERDRFREVIDLKKRKIHRLKKKGGEG